mmetsp:Transcript_162389/g.515940  ORF Transcript_162389/g.515940 Transcript_162389/m.515940 type:complete len:201 (-) Transcript_162389:751-1353(-)
MALAAKTDEPRVLSLRHAALSQDANADDWVAHGNVAEMPIQLQLGPELPIRKRVTPARLRDEASRHLDPARGAGPCQAGMHPVMRRGHEMDIEANDRFDLHGVPAPVSIPALAPMPASGLQWMLKHDCKLFQRIRVARGPFITKDDMPVEEASVGRRTRLVCALQAPPPVFFGEHGAAHDDDPPIPDAAGVLPVLKLSRL